jgi:hypothetical protein
MNVPHISHRALEEYLGARWQKHANGHYSRGSFTIAPEWGRPIGLKHPLLSVIAAAEDVSVEFVVRRLCEITDAHTVFANSLN